MWRGVSGYGKPFTEETEEMLLKALEPVLWMDYRFLAEEPFEPENQRALLPFLKKVRERFPKKNIWCYTGYLFDKGFSVRAGRDASVPMRC